MHVRPTASRARIIGCQRSAPTLRFQSSLANTSPSALTYATAGRQLDAIGNVRVGGDRIASKKPRPECETTIASGRVCARAPLLARDGRALYALLPASVKRGCFVASNAIMTDAPTNGG